MLLKQSTLMSPRSWLTESKIRFLALPDYGYVKEVHPKQNDPKLSNSKNYFDVSKSATVSWLKKEDNCCVITNFPTKQQTITY